jgi:acyl-CoA thioesterase I
VGQAVHGNEKTGWEDIILLYRKAFCCALLFITAVGLGIELLFPYVVWASPLAPRCDVPMDLVRFSKPLIHFSQKLASNESIVIVAIGSSSTAGTGASSPTANYPSRLAVELKQSFPTHSFAVVNRGVPGDEIGDMIKRLDEAVIANRPDLVIWQFGTNSIIHDHPFNDHGDAIRVGLKKIRSAGADVVLVDPQFAPKVLMKADVSRMIELIAITAKQEDVDLFRRYDVMQHWHDSDHFGFDTFISPDGLHMNDWSYACMAKNLAAAITEAVQRPVMSAKAVRPFVSQVNP